MNQERFGLNVLLASALLLAAILTAYSAGYFILGDVDVSGPGSIVGEVTIRTYPHKWQAAFFGPAAIAEDNVPSTVESWDVGSA
jgi:hypothetical protein